MKRQTCAIALAALLTGPLHAAGPLVERPWTHYNTLLEMLKMEKFYAAAPALRDKVIMQGVIHPDDPTIAPKDVVLTIVDGADRQRIVINADGSFAVPFNPDWVKANPEVLTSIPAGQKSKFGFQLLPVLPKRTQLDYASLMGPVPQANALIKSQAGVLRFMMPTMVGITLQFPKTAHASVSVGGSKPVDADAKGVVTLRLDKALMAANVPVTLSELPASADFLED